MSLNYDHEHSPKTAPIPLECRALVLEVGTWNVVAKSLPRFFNLGELDQSVDLLLAPPAARPAAATAVGKYRVQLATVRTQKEALDLAAKAKRTLAGALASREPEIDQAVLGNMGSFYRVRVGPFATVQETQAVCAKASDTGFDCMTVTQ